MSHFKSMFRAIPGKVRTYVLQVNEFADATVYSIGADGQPTDMVAGKVEDVLGAPIREMSVGRFLGSCGDQYHDSSHPFQWGFRVASWDGLEAILNGKSSFGRAYARGVYEALHRVNAPIYEWIRHEFSSRGIIWSATAKAREADVRAESRRAARAVARSNGGGA